MEAEPAIFHVDWNLDFFLNLTLFKLKNNALIGPISYLILVRLYVYTDNLRIISIWQWHRLMGTQYFLVLSGEQRCKGQYDAEFLSRGNPKISVPSILPTIGHPIR